MLPTDHACQFNLCCNLAQEALNAKSECDVIERLTELHKILFVMEEEQSNTSLEDRAKMFLANVKTLEHFMRVQVKENKEKFQVKTHKNALALLNTIIIFTELLLNVVFNVPLQKRKLRELEEHLLPLIFISSIITPYIMRCVALQYPWDIFEEYCKAVRESEKKKENSEQSLNMFVSTLERWSSFYCWNFVSMQEMEEFNKTYSESTVRLHCDNMESATDKCISREVGNVVTREECFVASAPQNALQYICPELKSEAKIISYDNENIASKNNNSYTITCIETKLASTHTHQIPNYLLSKRRKQIKKFSSHCLSDIFETNANTASNSEKHISCFESEKTHLASVNYISANVMNRIAISTSNNYNVCQKTFEHEGESLNDDDEFGESVERSNLSFMQYETPVKKRRRTDNNCEITIFATP